MADLSGETVRKILIEVYGYDIAQADADALARRAQPTLEAVRRLSTLGLDGIEQPFSLAVLLAEAQRIKR